MYEFLFFLFIAWFLFTKVKNNNIKKISSQPNEVVSPKFLTLSIVLIIIGFNLFLYGTAGAKRAPLLGFGLCNLFFVAAIMVSINKNKHSLLTWTMAGLSIFSGLALIFKANGFVQSVNAITMCFSFILLLFIHVYDDVIWKGLWFIKNFFALFPHTFRQILVLFKKSKTKTTDKTLNIFGVFKTIAITAAVLIFFTGLLSSADPVFSDTIAKFREEALGRTFASLLIAGLSLIFLTQRNHKNKEDSWKLAFFSFRDLFIPSLSLVTLFGVFLVVQSNYLFGSDVNLEAFDLTYSEYVRKGFVELLVTTFFGGLFSYLVIMKNRLTKISKYRLQLKFVNAVLLAELFLMLGSALKRDLMYVEAYGLTRVRIIGGLFLFWLAGLLALLLIMNLYQNFKEKKFWAGITLFSICVIVTLNIINIDQMVVNGSPEHHDYKDYFYINNLSEDGYRGWIESVKAIKSRTDLLLTKNSLTDKEKSQLAGDKLSLISLQEKRVDVAKKYAPEKWLLDNLCKELNCIYVSPDGKKTYSYNFVHNVDGSIDITNFTKQLPDSLARSRTWKYYNWPEHQACIHIINNEEIYFTQVDEILKDIRFYQLRKQLDLQKQEKWFTSEFSYPFININLNYYPEKLISYTKPVEPGEIFSENQVKLMVNNEFSILELINKSCDSVNKQKIELAVMMRPFNTTILNTNKQLKQIRRFQIWDSKSNYSINAVLDTGLAAEADIQKSFGKKTNSDFGKVTLQINKTGESPVSCFMSYSIIGWQEIMKLD